MRDSSVIFQFCVSPLTKPEMMTNKRTSTLIEVKTLLTQADSFTPNDRSPGLRKKAKEVSTMMICCSLTKFQYCSSKHCICPVITTCHCTHQHYFSLLIINHQLWHLKERYVITVTKCLSIKTTKQTM